MELKELRGEDMSSEKTTMKSLGDSTPLREKFCEFSQAAQKWNNFCEKGKAK